jgi:hypothetical protein
MLQSVYGGVQCDETSWFDLHISFVVYVRTKGDSQLSTLVQCTEETRLGRGEVD